MFLSFGKKSLTSKKNGAPVESPQGTSSPETSSSFTNHKSVSSRSTVQTTAGPLLSSSRFNSVLDPSTYANVNSPGFTSRVINSASNGSTSLLDERATHQNKYFSVGLFPRVQLGQSILPTLSPKNSQKVGRTPVRVRIASPSLTGHRRHSICGLTSDTSTGKRETLKRSPSAGQNSGTELFSTNLSGNAPSSAENTQESSRKRMFSECHDPCDEAKKRRRKAEMPIPNPNSDMYRYRHVRVPAISSYASPPDVPSQGKRAREKGSPEEQKRQRRKICNLNNAIFSSLSSSRNLLERLTAEKRKSADLSRPGSPSITLTRKKIEENTTRNDVKAIQSNMDFASHRSKSLLNVSPQDKTPISSRVISQKIDYPMKESPEKPRDKSQDTLKCDYTTKLFRKDVPSHSPRTPTSRPQKQSLWIQAPEVDEFTCSLLSGDSRVDRPERLKSLLACVSGKESANLEDNALPIVSTSSRTSKEEVKVFQPRISSPSSSSSKSLSPSGGNISSALTVTVSSTCTIMTSATVTSVNGVPSSESGSSPPLRPISVLSATPICLPNSPSTSTVIASVSNATTKISGETNQKHSTAVDNLDIVTSAGPVASFPSLPSVTQPAIKFSTTPCSLDPESLSKGSMMNQDDTAKVHRSGSSKQECNSFLVKSPSNSSVITSGTSSAPISQEPKSAFHSVTSSNSEPNVAPKAFQFSTKSQPLGTTVITPASVSQSTANSANPIGTEHSSSAPASSSFGTKPFSFGSSGKVASEVSNSGHQLPNTSFSMPNKGNDSFVLPKSSFDFGQSVGKDSEVPMLAQHSFSFGPSVHKDKEPVVLPKSTFTFGSNGVKNSTSTESEPSFQSRTGASGPQMSQNTFQFGSNVKNSSVSTEAPKLTGPSATSSNISSESPKTNFKFGSNTTKPTEIPKPGFQFVSGNQPVDSTKSTFQFGSSCYGASNPTAIFQVTSGTKSSGLQKPALLFGSTSNEVGTISQQSASHNSSVKAPSNSAFKFGSDADASTTPKHSFHFGSNVNGSSDIGKSPFQFSSGMDKPTESSKSSFQFSNNLVVPNFGSSSQNPTFSEGASKTDKFACASSNKLVTPGTFSFGSSGNIATCSVPTPGAMFGSGTTSSASGNQTIPAPGAIFGSGMTSSVSGIQTHSSTDPKSGGFGTTPTFGGASTFSFNSSTAVNSANTFQFGGTPQSGNAGPFPFGQDQAPGAFNFSATVTAVPSMSTSAPGLFSIGSGPSTTQRRTTTARRRR